MLDDILAEGRWFPGTMGQVGLTLLLSLPISWVKASIFFNSDDMVAALDKNFFYPKFGVNLAYTKQNHLQVITYLITIVYKPNDFSIPHGH